MAPWAATFVLTGLMLAACSAPAPRKAENAAVKKQAAEEIERICALKGAEREAALEKLKKDSGFELHCARD